MKRIFALLCLLGAAFGAIANDGAFMASGNQLIPVNETDVRVQKEILTLERVGGQINVKVYYEFFNPVGQKNLLVGFEAAGPQWREENDAKAFPEHPHIRGFKVIMNGAPLSWQVTHVERFGYYDENNHYEWVNQPYYVNGRFQSLSVSQCNYALRNWDGMDGYPFQFVYYFNACFKPGINIIEHTYNFDLSSNGGNVWLFTYILTAACRWANGQIDDFTLHIKCDRQSFCVEPTFFDDFDEWTFDVAGKVGPDFRHFFHVREGGITFHKNNFCPKEELRVFMPWIFLGEGKLTSEKVRSYVSYLYSLWNPEYYDYDLTAEDKLILRNLPFAFRGYVFKTPFLQRFFESTDWYIPDPSYKPDMDNSLSEEEKAWVMYWMK